MRFDFGILSHFRANLRFRTPLEQFQGRARFQRYKHVLTRLKLPTTGTTNATVKRGNSGGNSGRDWSICSLHALLEHFMHISSFYRDLMQQCIAQHGNVLRLVLYYDELTPGDAFAPDNRRKHWVIYTAFLEFGQACLSQEEAWLPIGVIRNTTVKTIEGGISNVIRLLLRSWCGRPMMLKELQELITIGSVCSLADLDAHRAVSQHMGTSSLRPCTKCRNVMMKGHKSCTARSWQVDITCKDFQKFDIATDEDIFQTLNLLQKTYEATVARAPRARVPKGTVTVAELEKAHGLHRDPYSMYMDMSLRNYVQPVRGVMYDPMHTMYQSGVFTIGVSQFLLVLRKVGKRHFTHIADFFGGDWQVPFFQRDRLEKLRQMWTPKREEAMLRKKGKLIKANASEQLGVYPMLRKIAAEMCNSAICNSAAMQPHFECFEALCDLADALNDAKFCRFDDRKEHHDKMMLLLVRYYKLQSELYGDASTKPKAHVMFHIISDFLTNGCILDCFALERMNLLPKRVSEKIQNTTTFEKSVIIRAIDIRSRQLETLQLCDTLYPEEQSAQQCTEFLGIACTIGDRLRLKCGFQLANNDVCFVGKDHACCFVKACFRADCKVGVFAERLEFLEDVGSGCSKWRRLLKECILMAIGPKKIIKRSSRHDFSNEF